MKPASPFSVVGIPNCWIKVEPIHGPTTIGMAIQKIIRTPRNLPRFCSGSRSFSQATEAIPPASEKACQSSPERASSGKVAHQREQQTAQAAEQRGRGDHLALIPAVGQQPKRNGQHGAAEHHRPADDAELGLAHPDVIFQVNDQVGQRNLHADAGEHDHQQQDEERAVALERIEREQLARIRPGKTGVARSRPGQGTSCSSMPPTSPTTITIAPRAVEEGEVADAVDQHAGGDHRDDLGQEHAQIEHALHPAARVCW